MNVKFKIKVRSGTDKIHQYVIWLFSSFTRGISSERRSACDCSLHWNISVGATFDELFQGCQIKSIAGKQWTIIFKKKQWSACLLSVVICTFRTESQNCTFYPPVDAPWSPDHKFIDKKKLALTSSSREFTLKVLEISIPFC